MNIGEKMTENRNVVYFSRFCQILFSACVHNVEINEEDVIPLFKLHKRVFSDLTNKDLKKVNVGELLLPERVHQFLNPQPQPQQQPETQPQQPEPESQQINSDSQAAPRPKTGGRTKHRAFKAVHAAKSLNIDDVPVSVGTSRKKKRANRPVSNANVLSNEPESVNAKKRKLVAAYLFDDIVQNLPSDSIHVHDSENVNVDTAVPEEVGTNIDDNAAFHDTFLDPILEMEEEENEIEAHPAISVCDTEDVAADQDTVIFEESMATQTEILYVTH